MTADQAAVIEAGPEADVIRLPYPDALAVAERGQAAGRYRSLLRQAGIDVAGLCRPGEPHKTIQCRVSWKPWAEVGRLVADAVKAQVKDNHIAPGQKADRAHRQPPSASPWRLGLRASRRR